MPVIIAPQNYERWLSPLEPDPNDVLVPFSARTHDDVADLNPGEPAGQR
jgi:putative SOS response-associated peptidase YedK